MVTVHSINCRESFSFKHKYCRMSEYGFVDLDSVIVTPSFRTINHWCFEIKYLGVVFQQANFLKVNVHSCKVKFFQAFNSIYGKIGNGNSFDTIVHMLKSNCLSVLLFNLESVNLTKTNLNNLEFPLHRAFIKIFHVKETNSILWCQYFMNQLPVESLLDFRRRNFYLKLCSTECVLLQHFFL